MLPTLGALSIPGQGLLFEQSSRVLSTLRMGGNPQQVHVSCVPAGSQVHVSCVPAGSQVHVSCVPPGSQVHVSCVPPGSQVHVSCVPAGSQVHVSCVPAGSQVHVSCVPAGSQVHVSCVPTGSQVCYGSAVSDVSATVLPRSLAFDASSQFHAASGGSCFLGGLWSRRSSPASHKMSIICLTVFSGQITHMCTTEGGGRKDGRRKDGGHKDGGDKDGERRMEERRMELLVCMFQS
ncbi:uncharacterized protein LOC121640505 isoform X1 [Melanotaenia boesemani]|uniref:uncharacterized protein LOC121640505 isoform X1 n=1 Tax=Melanotaenia boesemani TaxID=1250792 RepID=UPI001C0569FD|nr:uncharacterized protein LOC121640505 isoform X1 [Melanotaenia boesemani]XP_041842248.1 uncharacterized protein LOC121640505 isoform X1 [Melanotaenia boesemani]XP_041842249.1 uncharacterized protein LOC121640505 isoform X1 [Melanotaenia boesemani]